MIEKILNKFGYCKRPKQEKYSPGVIPASEPYYKNGVWYNVYDHITEDNLDKEQLKTDWEISSRLAPAEIARYQEFLKIHSHPEDDRYFEGPKHWIGFGSGGGIGKCVYVRCEHCGRVYDITDNSVW